MRIAALLLLSLLPLTAAGKWNVAYLYDEDESRLFIRAIEFPSDQRGIAIGILTEKGRQRPIALVTSDGGKSWAQVKLKDEALSLACYTDAVCWISTPGGVMRSEEGGRVWTKISNTKLITAMRFVSPTRGFAAGAAKSAWETSDGGKTWTLLPTLQEVKSNPANTSFLAVDLQGNYGMIGGNSRPPRRDRSPYPDWMVPEDVSRRREFPGVIVLLETRDGGKTWSSAVSSVFGTVTALRIRPDAMAAAALFEYFQTFEVPSEVILVDFKSGRGTTIFRDKTTAVTDVTLGPNGSTLVAGVEANAIRSLPIPQKVRFLEATIADKSPNIIWTKMDVDYRATARRVHLARQPNGQLWAATDTGIILRLDRDPAPVK